MQHPGAGPAKPQTNKGAVILARLPGVSSGKLLRGAPLLHCEGLWSIGAWEEEALLGFLWSACNPQAFQNHFSAWNLDTQGPNPKP